jgi:hypothetical protein
MTFKYHIFRKKDNAEIIEAETVQLFVTREGVFEVSTPAFYADWKQRWRVI